MKRMLIFLSALLAASLLSGCVVITSPKDEEFQKDWKESWDEIKNDLSGAESGEEDALDKIFDSLDEDWSAKAHRWQILDAAGEELYAVSSEEGVAAIDALLQDDGWGLTGKDPGEAMYTYVFWQEKTLLAGQDPDAEREYEALIRFTVPAEGNIVTMEILPESLKGVEIAGLDIADLMTFTGTAPAEALEALRNPAQWSES